MRLLLIAALSVLAVGCQPEPAPVDDNDVPPATGAASAATSPEVSPEVLPADSLATPEDEDL